MTTPVQPVAADRSAVQIARIHARQIVIVTLITGASGIVGALVQTKVIGPRSQRESVRGADSVVAARTTASERAILYAVIGDHLERDLAVGMAMTRRGRDSDEEFRYRALRRAVFLNVGRMAGDVRVLARALVTLTARGHLWVAAVHGRLLMEYPSIKAARLEWLAEAAIPLVQRSLGQGVPNAGLVTVRAALPPGVRGTMRTKGAMDLVQLDELAVLQRELELLAREP